MKLPLHTPAVLTAAIFAANAGVALAQSAETSSLEKTEIKEEIVVIGESGLMRQALERQRAADNIVSALNADAIGDLPDKNMAEALQRVPGISIERDQGEGRFVRIRGVSPDLNSVTVNGTQIPAPEAGRRAVALDVVPSALLSSVIVSKTLTPDMDANAIGGNIEVESLSAFERDGVFYSVTAGASYDEHTEETAPSGALSGGNTFDFGNGQKLGVVGALSWDNRKFGSDNVETGGAWDFDDGAQMEELEQRDYTVERERTGAALNLDFAFSQDHAIYWRTLYSEFTDTEQRLANVVEFGEMVPELDDNDMPTGDMEFDGGSLVEDDLGFAETARELKDRAETQEIMSTTIGGESTLDQWTVEYAVGYSQASETEPGSLDAAVFSADPFGNMGFYDTRIPRVLATAEFYDTANFALDEIEFVEAKTEDTQSSGRIDISRAFANEKFDGLIKFGAKISKREKTENATVYIFEDFDEHGFSDDDLALTGFVSGQADYEFGEFGPVIQPSSVYAVINSLDKTEFVDEEESNLADDIIDEDIQAAYLMGRANKGRWLLLGGVRYEGTEHALYGVGLDENDTFSSVNRHNEYDHLLPNLQARYDLSENAQLRAAWTNTVVRPTFEQMAPRFVDDGEEAEFGNTELEAMESGNFDLGVEWFHGDAGVLSLFVFYKEIDDFIFATDLAGTAQWQEYDEVITWENGDAATLSGAEFAYSQKLSQLPGFLSGLVFSVNTTVSDSSADISSSDEGTIISREISMPNQSDVTGNAILGYETDRFALRVAVNYKSEYLLEVSDFADATGDVWQDEQTQVDFSAQVRLAERWKLKFDINNITDEPYYTYVNNNRYNAQYEDYGPTYRLELSFTQL